MGKIPGDLERRVVCAAEAALTGRQVVGPVDVLVGLGRLAPSHVALWRQGRLETLEQALQVHPAKLAAALRSFDEWVRRRGLVASESTYVARTADRRALRFSDSGDPALERAYRTHWVSPQLPAGSRARLAERQRRPPELVVIEPLTD